jgi:hypothetical protein
MQEMRRLAARHARTKTAGDLAQRFVAKGQRGEQRRRTVTAPVPRRERLGVQKFRAVCRFHRGSIRDPPRAEMSPQGRKRGLLDLVGRLLRPALRADTANRDAGLRHPDRNRRQETARPPCGGEQRATSEARGLTDGFSKKPVLNCAAVARVMLADCAQRSIVAGRAGLAAKRPDAIGPALCDAGPAGVAIHCCGLLGKSSTVACPEFSARDDLAAQTSQRQDKHAGTVLALDLVEQPVKLFVLVECAGDLLCEPRNQSRCVLHVGQSFSSRGRMRTGAAAGSIVISTASP